MNVAIIGYGYVGKAMGEFFTKYDEYGAKRYQPLVYDPSLQCSLSDQEQKERINSECDLAVVCVPTPSKDDLSCDTSIVEYSIDWLKTDLILIKSTIVPGTVDKLVEKTGKNIAFSPEYCGEGDYNPGHNFQNTVANEPFYIFGGKPETTSRLVDIFQRIAGPTRTFFQCTAKEAELIKYMENSFLATKVVFIYEMHQIAESLGCDWNQVREGWLLDPRINRSHTSIFNDNKKPFTGKCLPKDVNAIVKCAENKGYSANFIKSVLESNERIGKIR